MTDNEIKKALNECLSFEMFESRTGLKIDDIADLINRLTDKLNSAINGQETLQEYIVKLTEETENYKKVAEHQQSVTLDKGFKIRELNRKIAKQDKEIEKLQEANETLRTVVANSFVIRVKGKSPLTWLKAEAYKECIEKVKEMSSECYMELKGEKIAGTKILVITEHKLDNLLEKMMKGK